MIVSLMDKLLKVRCMKCEQIIETDISGMVSRYVPDFNEFENIVILCEDCGTADVLVMNIPVNDTDEDIMTGEIPVEEEIARHYLRILQREIREDFLLAKDCLLYTSDAADE